MASSLQNLSIRDQLRLDRLGLRAVWLFVGLTGFGAGMAMIIRAGLGAAPWDSLSVAISGHTGLSVGTITILTSFVVLLCWIPLRQRPGLGTIANSLWVGVAADLTLWLVPPTTGLAASLTLMVAGVLVNALADALYIGAQLGPGPRDGLMTGLHHRHRLPLGPARLIVEGVVLLIAWLLGGPIGIGTLVYAAALGPIVHLVLPRVTIPVGFRPLRPDAERCSTGD